jgi:hypothetical protein
MIRRSCDWLVPELWRQRIHLARGGTDVFRPYPRETGLIQIHVPNADADDFLVDHVRRSVRIEWLNQITKSSDYIDSCTPDTRDMVGEIYRRDIELFGYEFA